MKHLPSTLTLVCVALTAIAFSAIVQAAETSILNNSKKIELPGGISLEMVKIEAGMFEMSKNSLEDFIHPERLTKDYFIGKTEVTQAQWKAVMESNPSYYKGDDLPVEKVSWNNAMEFCEKLNTAGIAPSGWKFSLPTETQWEFAASGGNKSRGYKYSGSNDLDAVAWYRVNSEKKTHPVGTKQANELGLYDMSGNVYEWCLDDFVKAGCMVTAEFMRGNDSDDSPRSVRGGSIAVQEPVSLLVGCRLGSNNSSDYDTGFRLALVQINSDKTVAGKKESLVNNGPKQNITDDMNYEELDQAVSLFTLNAKSCKVAKELLPSFFSGDDYFHQVGEYQAIKANNGLSYKEKKQALLKYYEKVIAHIKDVYSLPIEQWEYKCFSKESYFKGMNHSCCCCEWHATALAQRGSAKAQYQLGFSVLETSNYKNYMGVFFEDRYKTDLLWLKLAGENGVPRAYYVMGKASYDAKAYEAAIKSYKRGAELKQSDCMYKLGEIAKEVNEFSDAISWFADASELGSYQATLRCAELYQLNNQYTRANYKKAITYYEKAIQMLKDGVDSGAFVSNSYLIGQFEQKIKDIQLKIED